MNNGTKILVFLGIAIFIFGGLALLGSNSTNSTGSPSESTSDSVANESIESLELLAFNPRVENGFVIIDGQVKNISESSIQNLMIVVSFFNKKNQFVTFSESFVEYKPLMPGQTSPFRIMDSFNPEMATPVPEFREYGGNVIAFKTGPNL